MAWVGMLVAPPRTMTSLEGGYSVCSISNSRSTSRALSPTPCNQPSLSYDRGRDRTPTDGCHALGDGGEEKNKARDSQAKGQLLLRSFVRFAKVSRAQS
jgi:hypothetical protein